MLYTLSHKLLLSGTLGYTSARFIFSFHWCPSYNRPYSIFKTSRRARVSFPHTSVPHQPRQPTLTSSALATSSAWLEVDREEVGSCVHSGKHSAAAASQHRCCGHRSSSGSVHRADSGHRTDCDRCCHSSHHDPQVGQAVAGSWCCCSQYRLVVLRMEAC